MTNGLKDETLRQIYTTLGKCMAVSTQARLRALFVDSRIAQWRGIVPEADNRSDRIYLLVERLLDQQNAQEQSALALFLWVVSDNHETSIKYRRDLRSIAQAVTYELGFAPLNLSPPQSVGRDAPTVEPAVQESAATTLEETPGKQLADHKPTLWQMAAQWWLSLPIAGRRALVGVAGVALVIWLVIALANANPPTPTITPKATQASAAAAETTETPTLTTTASPPAPTDAPTPSLTPPPTLGVGSMMTSTVDGMAQMYVPAGPFTMGSDDGDSDEQPVHTVTLDAFWIDQTEVTNDQFAQFVAATSYETTAEEEGGGHTYTSNGWSYTEGADWQHPQGPGSSLDGLSDHPVVLVSWHDAAAYCEWAGRRLPTEAEWEKAARGTDERIYPWGDQFDGNRVNFCDSNCPFSWKDNSIDDGYQFTAPVGSYPAGASPYGALDMAGNVWEWTLSLFQPYPYNPDDGRESEAGTNVQALRSGSRDFSASVVRAANRDRSAPALRNDNVGFRCAQGYLSPP